MKLERLHEYVLPVVAMMGGIGFALFCGYLVGEGQTGKLLLVFYCVFMLGGLLVVRQNIWSLIPLVWPFAGQIPELPLPFAVRDLAIFSAFGGFLILKAFKAVHYKPKMEMVDFCLLLMLLDLLSVFLRNPVGVDALGADRVGGKPYFNICVAAMAYWVLARVVITDRMARNLPFLMLFGAVVESSLSIISYHFPSTGPLLSRFYTGISSETYNAQDLRSLNPVESTGRQTYLLNLGQPLVRALCAWFRPVTLIIPFYFVRFCLFMGALTCILLAGFRGGIFFSGVVFLFCTYFRRGMSEVIRLSFVGFACLLLLISFQGRLYELPLSAQRALSFLPGKWDSFAVQEAKASTEWRVRMWKDSLFTDKYIQSKAFGDGFGFTKRQLEWVMANSFNMTDEDQQEHYLVVGGVHSGPVSTIRYVGVFGLIIFTWLMIVMAKMSWQLIVRSKNTPFFAACLFVGVPVIWEPFAYYLIFGGFDTAMPAAIFSLGMLKVLKNSLDARDAKLAQQSAPATPTGPVLMPVRRPLAPVGVGMGLGATLAPRPQRS